MKTKTRVHVKVPQPFLNKWYMRKINIPSCFESPRFAKVSGYIFSPRKAYSNVFPSILYTWNVNNWDYIFEQELSAVDCLQEQEAFYC